MREQLAGEHGRRREVHGELQVPVGEPQPVDPAELDRAGHVDQGVDRAVDLAADPVERAGFGEVGHDHLRACEGAGQLVGARLGARDQHEVVTPVREALRQCAPDARTGAGEDVLHGRPVTA